MTTTKLPTEHEVTAARAPLRGVRNDLSLGRVHHILKANKLFERTPSVNCRANLKHRGAVVHVRASNAKAPPRRGVVDGDEQLGAILSGPERRFRERQLTPRFQPLARGKGGARSGLAAKARLRAS